MVELLVWTFFYGSYINTDVLKQANFHPKEYEVAKLNGYDIQVKPLANLYPSENSTVYGIVAKSTQKELVTLYEHASGVLGGTYYPTAVLIETVSERYLPSLCYIAPELPDGKVDNDYVDRIITPGRQLGFPQWYLRKLESFKS